MAAPAHGGGGAAAAFLEPSGWGGTDGGVPGAAPSRSAPERGTLRELHAWRRRGEARPRCRRPSPRRRSERGPATRGRRHTGLVSARGGSVRGLFHGAGLLRWDKRGAFQHAPVRPKDPASAGGLPGWSITCHVCDVVPAHQKAKHGGKKNKFYSLNTWHRASAPLASSRSSLPALEAPAMCSR